MSKQLDPHLLQLIHSTFQIISLIKQGTKGPIYLVQNRFTQQKLVLKCIDLKIAKSYGSQYQTQYKTELNIMMEIKHDNILKCHYFIENSKWRVLILQYCESSSLFDKIKQKGMIQEEVAVKIISQIIQAFSVLQNQKIIHRNLKSEKVLIHGDRIKISGLQNFKQSSQQKLIEKMNYTGNRFTNAPQLYGGNQYDFQADIWSLGVIYYEMLNGSLPFKDIITENRVDNLHNDIDTMKISKQSKDFLKGIFVINPSKRLKWSQLYKMFYSKNNLFRKTIFMKEQQKTIILNGKDKKDFTFNIPPIQQNHNKTTLILSEKKRPTIITEPKRKIKYPIQNPNPQKLSQSFLKKSSIINQQFPLLLNNFDVIQNIFGIYSPFHNLLSQPPSFSFYKCKKQILLVLMLIDSQLIQIINQNSSYHYNDSTIQQIKQFSENNETIIQFNKYVKDIHIFSFKHKQDYKSFISTNSLLTQRPNTAQNSNKQYPVVFNNESNQKFFEYKCTEQQHIIFTLKSYQDFVMKIPENQRKKLQSIDSFMKQQYKQILHLYKVKK